jgi:hypothetical protein
MNAQNWAEQDIDRGINYLSGNELEATENTILTAGDDLLILLPTGLPAVGANVVGMFMMAPLLLFMLVLTLFPIQILWSANSLSLTPVILVLLCLSLLWGLSKVFQLMLRNRDLFPRCYFVTLGARGIAMHFTRLHFPVQRPCMSIAWKDIQGVKKNTLAFMPFYFFGFLRATTVDVVSSSGDKVIIPFRLSDEKALATAKRIEELISQKTKNKTHTR